MREIRKEITKRLPGPLVTPARKAARHFDYLTGLPFANKRPGVALNFHIGRSGSTLLGNLLNQHSDIFWDGEIYNTAWVNDGNKIIDRDWRQWTKKQFNLSGSRYYGFECKPLSGQHLAIVKYSLPRYIDMTLELGVTHFIVLKRKNFLRCFISDKIGAKTKIHELTKPSDAKRTTLSLDPNKVSFWFSEKMTLLEALTLIDNGYADLEELLKEKNTLVLHYEDDLAENNGALGYRKVCEHLELSSQPVANKNARVNPYPLKELLENFDQIHDHLKGTKYEWMLME